MSSFIIFYLIVDYKEWLKFEQRGTEVLSIIEKKVKEKVCSASDLN